MNTQLRASIATLTAPLCINMDLLLILFHPTASE
jgi:hypothetical protein